MKKILFVCVENACRSQIAQGLLNTMSSKATANSAGTQLAESINPKAIEVMNEIGIDISEQKPKQITSQINQEYDYIITMGCIDGCPLTPREKTIEWDIPDPKGKDIAYFREVRETIKNHIQDLLKEHSLE